MSNKYVISEDSIITRRYAKRIADEARTKDCSAIDLSNVESISRSVADELVHQTNDSDLRLTGMSGDVRKIIQIVSNQTEPVV